MRFLLVSADDPKVKRSIEVPAAIVIRKTICTKPIQRIKSTTTKVNSQIKKKQVSKAILNHGYRRNKQGPRSS